MSNWKDQTREAALNVYDYAQNWVSPTLKLGVTGLSRSGKTVFITSLIYHLLHPRNLRFFEPAMSGRIINTYLEPHPDDMLPRFDYEGNLAKLLGTPPTWPKGTRQISQLRLTIIYKSEHVTARLLGPSKLHIDIVDYPGEWLIDLALLEKDYQTWSAEVLNHAKSRQNNPKIKSWLATLKTTDIHGPTDEGKAQELSRTFLALLNGDNLNGENNDNNGLANFCPGRFLMPGELKGAPALTFAPLDLNSAPIKPDTLAGLMQRRFEAYKQHIARPFYNKFFTRLDRQIVLVDLLSALNGGEEKLRELQTSLENILKNFNPGARHWLTSIWNRKIDRLVFAATKADHLHHHGHDQLQELLSHLTKAAINRAEMNGASVKVQALAALKTTQEMIIEQGGESFSALKGTPMQGETFENQTFDGRKEIHFFPGDLPNNLDTDQQNPLPDTTMTSLNFTPPDPATRPQMPHIRLDRALNMLIGDKLV